MNFWKKICLGSVLIGGALFLTSCSSLMEIPKTIWGSSTREVEQARDRSIYSTYSCSKEACYQAIKDFANDKEYTIFIDDYQRGLLVLMGFEQVVDTTEIGVFISETDPGLTLVEISSASSFGKRVAAKEILYFLGNKYPLRKVDVIPFDE